MCDHRASIDLHGAESEREKNIERETDRQTESEFFSHFDLVTNCGKVSSPLPLRVIFCLTSLFSLFYMFVLLYQYCLTR